MTQATACISTPPTPTTSDLDALREYKISRQLEAAGLRLQKAPRHLPDGYRIYYGNQILAGNEYGLTLDSISEFIRRAGLLR
jgi:hypothetical protein